MGFLIWLLKYVIATFVSYLIFKNVIDRDKKYKIFLDKNGYGDMMIESFDNRRTIYLILTFVPYFNFPCSIIMWIIASCATTTKKSNNDSEDGTSTLDALWSYNPLEKFIKWFKAWW